MATIEGLSFNFESLQFSRTVLSSVGGFSQPTQRGIHSLQGLLTSVRKLNLDTFEKSSFTFGANAVGEGVSYKVWRCYHRTQGAVYAVKQIKLPSADHDMHGFQRQIGCILRDLEVMAGLARHPNVLNLVGYGWDHNLGGVLPFLVTEFAPGGTLRDFLKDHKISAEEKVILCQDVARGLHALHVSGIAHGDLKLDNVLASGIPDSQVSGPESEIPDIHARRFGVVARLSDFGHSLRILYNEEAPEHLQRYGGTLIYNAPEVEQSRHSIETAINFRKCDVWSLGLLCWEVFRDGYPYYNYDQIQKRIDSARGTPRNTNSSTSSARTLTSTELEDLLGTCSEFGDLAAAETRQAMSNRLGNDLIYKLEGVYQRTLAVDPENRVADIPFIPLFSQLSATQASPEDNSSQSSSWTFDIFRAARFLPHYVKQQVLSDCMELGAEPGTSDVAARAAFQAAMAYLVGFGTRRDKSEGEQWFKTSVAKGLLVAGSFQPLFDEKTAMLHTFLGCVRHGFRKVLKSEDDAAHLSPWTFSEEFYKRFDLSEGGITRIRDEKGDSALMYACKLGDSQAAQHLLDLSGKSPDLEGNDASGTNYLHWLFMFPDKDIPHIASCLIKNAQVPILVVSGESDGLIPLVDSSSRAQVDHVVTNPQRLDPQLPIRLQGTPLAFATATNCMAAVKELLHHHADPLCGIVPWRSNILNESAIHVATKLHVADILDLFLHDIAGARFNFHEIDYTPLLLAFVLSLPTAYPLERILIHGDNYKTAARETILVLMNHLHLHEIPISLWSFLRPAIEYADLDLAETISDIVSFKDIPLVLSDSELGELIVCCTIGACSAVFDEARSLELLKFALRLGSKIDGDPATELRPINIAIDYHSTLVLEWLIEQGADVNIRDSHGRTPVHVLFESDFSSSFGLSQLVDAGANCVARTNEGLTPLDIAMQKGKCEDIVALLTSRCRDFIFQSTNYQSIFLDAIKLRNSEIASKILELAYADGQLESIDLSLALCHAVYFGYLELTDYLLSLGADPHADVVMEGEAGKPSWVAASIHHSGAIKLFLDHGKLDVTEFSEGHTMLTAIVSYASNEPHDRSAAESFDLLLEAGSDVNTASPYGVYPLQVAIECIPPIGKAYALMERLWFVKRLLKAGADPNLPLALHHFPKETYTVVTEDGQEFWYPPLPYQNMTPLQYAIIKGDHQLVQLLLDNGATTTATVNDGRSALQFCAAPAHYQLLDPSTDTRSFGIIAQALLARDVDVLYEGAQGKVALDLAVESNNAEVVRAILIFLRDTQGYSRTAYATRFRSWLLLMWGIAEFCTIPTNFLRWLCLIKLTDILQLAMDQYEFMKILKPIHEPLARRVENSVNKRIYQGFVSETLSMLIQLDSAWDDAIKWGHWGCVCAFIESDLYGQTSELDLQAALQTLRYAVETENAAVLTKFMGTSPSSQSLAASPPDAALQEFWKTCQVALSAFSPANLQRLHGIVDAGGFFPVKAIENLETQGFVEAQTEGGMAQVITNGGFGEIPFQPPDDEATHTQDGVYSAEYSGPDYAAYPRSTYTQQPYLDQPSGTTQMSNYIVPSYTSQYTSDETPLPYVAPAAYNSTIYPPNLSANTAYYAPYYDAVETHKFRHNKPPDPSLFPAEGTRLALDTAMSTWEAKVKELDSRFDNAPPVHRTALPEDSHVPPSYGDREDFRVANAQQFPSLNLSTSDLRHRRSHVQ
ncbi:hypothetical protein BDV95DRAFT_305008 [Massariosphaeria phaeospora]|uniref:Protein kinase domain-containing protein n=1 Tax=Massariosphaeria phaeospora TaxID=100035 RepID=A0A7C8MCQ5_9PLEO|nr:hypothetical protein BDV95DRAFT_305008 [Massariosphaeria phaeospora]